jgi:RNA polymerase-interacting CarD/CdnL/TRCF family regulator
MTRANLGRLVGQIDTTAHHLDLTPRPSGATAQVDESSNPDRLRVRDQDTSEAPANYLQFERKDTRLRADQLTSLTRLARDLTKAKGPNGVRITENTLIRVAVDLLLSETRRLTGATEDDLRRSLGATK